MTPVPDTYQIKKLHTSPITNGVKYFLVFIVFWGIVMQWVGHSSLSAHLPPPVLDVGVPNFNIKINYLEEFIRQNGKLDCLLFGSSHILNGLDPVVIEQEYQKQTGYKIKCFNFGLETLTVDTAGPLLSALVSKYHPKLVVFEISARSFSSDFGDLTRPLQDNAWVRQQNGDTSVTGWLLEHVFGYRYYLTLKTWQFPQNRKVMLDHWNKTSMNGYAPLPTDAFLTNSNVYEVKFRIDPRNWDGFIQVLALQGDTKLVFLEPPVQESFLPHYLKGGVGVYELEFVAPVSRELSMRDIPFWRALKEVSPLITDSMWFDPRHVNADGAGILSNWLGHKMAQEISPEIFR